MCGFSGCKDKTRPFCRLEKSGGKGTCGCPDKTSYLSEYQTSGYKWDINIQGYGRAGRAAVINAGGSSGDRPFAEAAYKVIFVNGRIDDYVAILRDNQRIGQLRNNTQDQVFTFPKGSNFTAELWNEGKKN